MGGDSGSTFGCERFENSPQEDQKVVLLFGCEGSDGVFLECAPRGVHGSFFADTPAYQADIAAVRRINADLWNLQTWLQATNYSLASN